MLCLCVSAYIGVGKQSFKHENGLVFALNIFALNNTSPEVACFEKA
jgi:hypothetical protein